ncbi:hypothetical protein JMN32_08930 [Fulvivirga sp. 29W222]|uniref:YD repeat-containing protein n=1 Tax=Fulvivirga marina TaxID=2494733 RepID=A0A937FXY8_9BACT|nr:hypothetical protein [Fulvivirga marina]MBL6446430.1 hypothetical protein [Fulvivirga marina]
MIRILVCILVLSVVIGGSLKAQEDFLPASPNAAALGKYGHVPVGLNTGTLQLSVPVYEYSGGNLTVPISLNYSSNGIKVDELPSHVGLGWVLSAGGAVTRMARDKPDGDLANRWQMPDAPYDSDEMLIFLRQVNHLEGDAQPDIFAFNFLGNYGKFYIDNNGEAVMIDPSPLKIELLSSFSDPYDPNDASPEIRITDSRGVIYTFGAHNAGEVGLYRSTKTNNGVPTPPYDVENAWYIDRIIHPTGDEIIFEYTKSAYSYNASISQSFSKLVYENVQAGPACYNGTGDDVSPEFTTAHMTTSVLQRIYSPQSHFSVNFTYSAGILTPKLDSITVLNDQDGSIVKKINLGYTAYASTLFQNKDITHQAEDLGRLFLTSVSETGSNGESKPPYAFTYYSPNQLPARFSYAQDYWGYFNGKDNSFLVPNELGDIYIGKTLDFYDAIPYLPPTIKGVYQNIGGDKSPSGAHAKKGMLRQVTYPTGGYNEFFYEPHSYYDTKTTLATYTTDAHLKLVSDNVDGSNGFGGIVDSYEMTGIYSDQEVEIHKSISFNVHGDSCYQGADPDHWISATFKVYNKTTDQRVSFYKETLNPPHYRTLIGDEYIFTPNTQDGRVFFDIEAGHTYMATLKISRPCIETDITFQYRKGATKVEKANIEVGGVRVSKIITDDGAGEQQVKKIYYGTPSCPDCSTGVIELPKADIWVNTIRKETTSEISTCTYAALSSNTFKPLYSLQGNHITYKTVIEGFGENAEYGRTIHYFNTISDAENDPQVYNGDPLAGTPNTNTFGQGEELRTVYQKWVGDRFISVRTIDNDYMPDNRLDQEIKGFSARKYNFYSSAIGTDGFGNSLEVENDDPLYYDFAVFKARSKWRYLETTVDSLFDDKGANPVIKTTYYRYDNPEHLQTTYMKTENSGNANPEIIESYVTYPDDYTSTSFSALKNNNIVTVPIKTQKVVNGNQVEGQITSYNSNGQPLDVYGYRSDLLKAPEPHDPTGIDYTDHTLETQVRYNDQTDKVKQITKIGNRQTAYLWGYNDTKPIAEVKNAVIDHIFYNSFEKEGTLDESKAKTGRYYHNSGSYTIPSSFNPTNISQLKLSYWYWNGSEWLFSGELAFTRNISSPGSKLDEIRVYPEGALMTTYTYKEEVGLTSKTDANNISTYYKYDGLGRLILVSDDDRHPVQRYEYNYAGQ